MKVCPQCGEGTDFAKHAGRSDGLQTECRECKRKYARRYYRRHATRMKKQIAVSKQRRRAKTKAWVLDLLLRSKCMDCPEKDVRVLEFDHVRGRKQMDVSKLLGYASITRLKLEIKKCDIVCANCHRRRTYSRKGCYRTRVSEFALVS